MDPDLLLVIGVAVGIFCLPAFLGALSVGRVPMFGSLAMLLAGGAIVAAILLNPTGYRFAELPDVLYRVIGRTLN